MRAAGAADWVVVGAAVLVDVVGEAWCGIEWQPHIVAPTWRMVASRAGITALLLSMRSRFRLFTDTTNIE
jgi:hypothetical protein